MKTADLSQDFRLYREAVRMLWNVFLSNCYDQEDSFPEVDDALFRAICLSRVNFELEKFGDGWDKYYRDIKVTSKDSSILRIERGARVNSWRLLSLPSERLDMRYISLFDFGAANGEVRDSEYIKCRLMNNDALPDKNNNIVLVPARTAIVKVLIPRGDFVVYKNRLRDQLKVY